MRKPKFKKSEDDVIILLLGKGMKVVDIASILDRSKHGVYKRMRVMRATGRLAGKDGGAR